MDFFMLMLIQSSDASSPRHVFFLVTRLFYYTAIGSHYTVQELSSLLPLQGNVFISSMHAAAVLMLTTYYASQSSKCTVCKLSKPQAIGRAVGRSPKCRKNPARRILKNLRNINWYSCYELFKTGKFHTFLVSFMILASCAE